MAKRQWEIYLQAIKKQDWTSARQALESISLEEGSNPRLFLKFGDICRRTGDVAGAISHYLKSASILTGQGFNRQALALYKIILEIDPGNETAILTCSRIVAECEPGEASVSIPCTQAAVPEPAALAESATQAERAPELQPEVRLEARFQVEPIALDSDKSPTRSVAPIFSGISPTEFTKFISECAVRSFSDGEMVLEEGDSGDSIYVMRKGKARVIAHIFGKKIELAILEDGDVFGEVAFLTGRPRTASVIADGPVEVYEVTRLTLEILIAENPEILSKMEDFHKTRVDYTIRKVMRTRGNTSR